VHFLLFWAATHIARVNCAEMAGSRPRYAAYKISALNVDFSSISRDPLSLTRPVYAGVK